MVSAFKFCCLWAVVCCLHTSTAFAFDSTSLKNIQRQAFIDDDLKPSKQLLDLAVAGDPASQQYYALALEQIESEAALNESIEWHKQAFDEGRGVVRALIPVTTLAYRNALVRDELTAWLKRAVTQYPHSLDLNTTVTTLEVFYHFPDLVEVDVKRLIQRYERSCIAYCRPLLYYAKLYEIEGYLTKAAEYYHKAIQQDARAVDAFYQTLGDDRQTLFEEFAERQLPFIDNIPTPVIARIGTTLATIAYDTRASHDPAVDIWLETAMARGDIVALKELIVTMLSWPDLYGYDATLARIQQLKPHSPHWADYYLAQAHMTLSWRKLRPEMARQTFERLIGEGHNFAYLGLAELVSKGFEDEVNRPGSIPIFEKAARLGVKAADAKMASTYGILKGMCRDYVKAYAHAKIAYRNGDLTAFGLMNRFEPLMSAEERLKSQKYMNQVLQGRAL